MVKLNKIYTKTGDAGETRLATGQSVSKSSARVEAYGAVDEANSAIGMVRAALDGDVWLGQTLERIQNDMFDLGADLATPEPIEGGLTVIAAQVDRLEREIDEMNARQAPLESFVLPGGSESAARLHVARAITRRAERRAIALGEAGETVNPEAIRYLNRLSDLLFVAARRANDDGASDVTWTPGANR